MQISSTPKKVQILRKKFLTTGNSIANLLSGLAKRVHTG